MWTPLTHGWHVFLSFFLLLLLGELLQVVLGADVSERLVMCSVREVSGLSGGQGAVVAVSPAEGGWGHGSRYDWDLGRDTLGGPSGSSGRSPASAGVVA